MPKTNKRTKVAEDGPHAKNIPSKKRKIDLTKAATVSQKPAETKIKKAAAPTTTARGRPKKLVTATTKTFKVKIGSKPPEVQNESKPKSKSTTRVKNETPVEVTLKSEIEGVQRKTKKVNRKESGSKKDVVKRTKMAVRSVSADANAKPRTDVKNKLNVVAKPRGRARKKQISTPVSPIMKASAASANKKPNIPARKSSVPKSAPKPTGKTVGKQRGRKPAERNKVAVSDFPKEQTKS